MTERELVHAAVRLAHRAPEEWAQLISVLTAFVDKERDELVSAPLHMLPVAQGRAQAFRQIRNVLADCMKTSQKIEKRFTQTPQYPL